MWARLDLSPIIGFPIWEAEIHPMLAERALPLLDLFAHYCGGPPTSHPTSRRAVAAAAAPAAAAPPSPPRGGRYNPLLHHKGQPAAPPGYWALPKGARGTAHPATDPDDPPPRARDTEVSDNQRTATTAIGGPGTATGGGGSGDGGGDNQLTGRPPLEEAMPLGAMSLADFARLVRSCGAGAGLPSGAAVHAFARFAEPVAGGALAAEGGQGGGVGGFGRGGGGDGGGGSGEGGAGGEGGGGREVLLFPISPLQLL